MLRKIKSVFTICFLTLFIFTLLLDAQPKQIQRFQNPWSNPVIQKMYMHTYFTIHKAGSLCKIHKRELENFHKLVYYQLLARDIFLGDIPHKNRNKFVAALTMKAREMARKVIEANYGECLRDDLPIEKEAASGMNESELVYELKRLEKESNFFRPSLNEILEDKHFYLGDEQETNRKFRKFNHER